MRNSPKSLGYKEALEKMRRGDTRLVKMRSDDGFAYYVVPGGYVQASVAEKIKQHPFCRANQDGLFPGHDQTWALMMETPQ